MSDQTIIVLGLLVFFAGIVLVIASLALSSSQSGDVRGKGGAVVIIGPFPIVFGSDKRTATQLLILAIILVLVLIAFYLAQIL